MSGLSSPSLSPNARGAKNIFSTTNPCTSNNNNSSNSNNLNQNATASSKNNSNNSKKNNKKNKSDGGSSNSNSERVTVDKHYSDGAVPVDSVSGNSFAVPHSQSATDSTQFNMVDRYKSFDEVFSVNDFKSNKEKADQFTGSMSMNPNAFAAGSKNISPNAFAAGSKTIGGNTQVGMGPGTMSSHLTMGSMPSLGGKGYKGSYGIQSHGEQIPLRDGPTTGGISQNQSVAPKMTLDTHDDTTFPGNDQNESFNSITLGEFDSSQFDLSNSVGGYYSAGDLSQSVGTSGSVATVGTGYHTVTPGEEPQEADGKAGSRDELRMYSGMVISKNTTEGAKSEVSTGSTPPDDPDPRSAPSAEAIGELIEKFLPSFSSKEVPNSNATDISGNYFTNASSNAVVSQNSVTNYRSIRNADGDQISVSPTSSQHRVPPIQGGSPLSSLQNSPVNSIKMGSKEYDQDTAPMAPRGSKDGKDNTRETVTHYHTGAGTQTQSQMLQQTQQTPVKNSTTGNADSAPDSPPQQSQRYRPIKEEWNIMRDMPPVSVFWLIICWPLIMIRAYFFLLGIIQLLIVHRFCRGIVYISNKIRFGIYNFFLHYMGKTVMEKTIGMPPDKWVASDLFLFLFSKRLGLTMMGIKVRVRIVGGGTGAREMVQYGLNKIDEFENSSNQIRARERRDYGLIQPSFEEDLNNHKLAQMGTGTGSRSGPGLGPTASSSVSLSRNMNYNKNGRLRPLPTSDTRPYPWSNNLRRAPFLIANHLCYLDSIVLFCRLGNVRFLAKKELVINLDATKPLDNHKDDKGDSNSKNSKVSERSSSSKERPKYSYNSENSASSTVVVSQETKVEKKKKEKVTWIGSIAGPMFDDLQFMLVDRDDKTSRSSVVGQIRNHGNEWRVGKTPLCVFPEGTFGNGKKFLPFRRGAFVPGLPVQAVVIQYRSGMESGEWWWGSESNGVEKKNWDDGSQYDIDSVNDLNDDRQDRRGGGNSGAAAGYNKTPLSPILSPMEGHNMNVSRIASSSSRWFGGRRLSLNSKNIPEEYGENSKLDNPTGASNTNSNRKKTSWEDYIPNFLKKSPDVLIYDIISSLSPPTLMVTICRKWLNFLRNLPILSYFFRVLIDPILDYIWNYIDRITSWRPAQAGFIESPSPSRGKRSGPYSSSSLRKRNLNSALSSVSGGATSATTAGSTSGIILRPSPHLSPEKGGIDDSRSGSISSSIQDSKSSQAYTPQVHTPVHPLGPYVGYTNGATVTVLDGNNNNIISGSKEHSNRPSATTVSTTVGGSSEQDRKISAASSSNGPLLMNHNISNISKDHLSYSHRSFSEMDSATSAADTALDDYDDGGNTSGTGGNTSAGYTRNAGGGALGSSFFGGNKDCKDNENEDNIIEYTDALWFLQFFCRFYVVCELTVLPVYCPGERERKDPNLYAKNVEQWMGRVYGQLERGWGRGE